MLSYLFTSKEMEVPKVIKIKWQGWNLNLGSLNPKSVLLTSTSLVYTVAIEGFLSSLYYLTVGVPRNLSALLTLKVLFR